MGVNRPLRIAITSRIYFPSIGGVPVYLRLLANAWQELGHDVMLLTSTPASAENAADSFRIIRRPTIGDLFSAARWCDLVFQAELSVQMVLPFILLGRPAVVSHHTHFAEDGQTPLWRRIQGIAAARCHPVSVSSHIRRGWGGHGVVIGNPFDDSLFHASDTNRTCDILFVGRLVKDKGLDVLLAALAMLQKDGVRPSVRVVGDEWSAGKSTIPDWQQQVAQLGLTPDVEFVGPCDAATVAHEMRRARILVVPSTWPEPFGIVVLEGLASGCCVVASSGGGMMEAGGAFPFYFENGSASSLADALKRALAQREVPHGDALNEHLDSHRVESVAQRYVHHFRSVLTPS